MNQVWGSISGREILEYDWIQIASSTVKNGTLYNKYVTNVTSVHHMWESVKTSDLSTNIVYKE